jgi:hypothetical protein
VSNGSEHRYLNARVEGAKTVAEAYSHHHRDPEAFVAGVQYALDKLLGSNNWDVLKTFSMDKWAANVAVDILERAKRGEPQ